jgi:hypothetical protein
VSEGSGGRWPAVEFSSNCFGNETGQGSMKQHCFVRGSEGGGAPVRFG